jgi:site-specific DNA recombinase
MKAVIYARAATRVLTENRRSIKWQVAAARQNARANGFEVAKIFTDAGFSGAKLDRPALNKMRAFIACNSIDVVIVGNLSRLSCSPAQYIVLLKELVKRRIQLHSVADEIRLGT